MSATNTPVMSSFNGGELSRRMHGRVDTNIYPIAVEAMENFCPTIEGAAVKRPGFEYIKPAAASAAWLSRFQFNLTQAYVLEWLDGQLRFFTNGGRIETAPNVPYQVAVPYAAADAPAVSAQQSFDVLYLAHGDHPSPATLSRTGATTFAYAVPELDGGPFADQNIDEAVTVSASAVTGSVTLTASSGIWSAGHVGALFRIEAQDFAAVKAWEVGYNGVTVGLQNRSDGKVYEADAIGSEARTGSVQPVHTRGSEWDGGDRGVDINGDAAAGVRWKYLHDRFGILRITGYTSPTQVTATVIRRLPDSLVGTPSFRWAQGLFSAAAGWPSIVLIAFGRLFLIKDFDLVASVAGDYRNFKEYDSTGATQPDLSFRRRLSLANPPLWARADRKQILIGTADGVYAIAPLNPGEPISGSNIDAVPQTYYGAADVPPVQIGTETIYAQRGRRKLRVSDYDFGRDRNRAMSISTWARHIARGVRQLAYQAEPEELLFGVRDDGQMFVHPRDPDQEIKGFGRIIPAAGGVVVSAVTMPSEDGALDELWALIERGGAKSIERLARWWDEDDAMALTDAFFLDSGKTFIGSGLTTIASGLDHLNGRTVAVVADGAIMADQLVTGGALPGPIGRAADVVHIGLRYQARIKTLRAEVKDRSGQSGQGKRKRLITVALRLLETVGIRVSADFEHYDNIIDRPGSAPMNAPVPLFTGDTNSKTVVGDWSRDGQFELVSDDPLPCIVLAAMPRFEVSEK